MKKLIIALICTVISTSSIAASTPSSTLTLKGFFMKKKNINYKVFIMNPDSTYTEVEAHKSLFTYEIKLDVGKEYLIQFTKNDITKEMYVIVDHAGEWEVDINFANDVFFAELRYDTSRKHYVLIKGYEREYDYAAVGSN